MRHGILARNVVLDTDEKRMEYERIWQSWDGHFHPQGPLEGFLVEEVTNISWKLGITETLETKELSRRRYLGDGVDGVFDGELKLPISGEDLPLDRGWDCERMVVRAVAGNDQRNSSASRGPGFWQNQVVKDVHASIDRHDRKVGHLEVQAVLSSSIDTLTRYRSALKRDLYKAIEMLRVVQEKRREHGQ